VARPRPDRRYLLFNGKNPHRGPGFFGAQALAIDRGRVLATGTSAAMKKLAGDKARLIDLGGRTVIPGLTDGHIHGNPRRADLRHEVTGSAFPPQGGIGKSRQAAQTQKSGSWMSSSRAADRGAVRGETPAGRRRGDGGGARQSGLHPASYDWLLLNPNAMRR